MEIDSLKLDKMVKDSTKDFKLVDIETLFLKDFIVYWNIIRDNRPQKIDEINQVSKKLFPNYTQPIIKKWKHLSFIKLDKQMLKEYHSFIFQFPNGNTILIPHKILVFETLRPKERVYNYLRRIRNFKEFLFYFERTCRDMNLPLNKTDVKILQKSSSNEFTRSSEKIPNIQKLAEFCNCDPLTFWRRMKRLEDTYILHYVYLIDIARLGYETFISIGKNFDSKYQSYVRYSFPCNNGVKCTTTVNDDYRIIIYQIPRFKTNIYFNIKNDSELLFQKMSHSYIGSNLSSLTPSVESRWRNTPPILSIMEWDEEVITPHSDIGIYYNLNLNTENLQLSQIEAKFLSLFVKHGRLKNIEIAKKLGVSERYVRRIWSKISKFNLIRRFPHISNIGFSIRTGIIIMGNDPQIQGLIISRIVEHLKSFPFTWLFYEYGDIENNIKPIIVGLIALPPSWLNDFFYKLSLLKDYGLSTQIDISYDRYSKWNLSIYDTY